MTAQNKLEITGKLVRTPLAELLVEIEHTKLDGSLRLSNDQQKIVIYFNQGKIVFAVSNSRKHRLFEILLGEKMIASQDLRAIENFTNDLFLAQNLIRQGVFSKENVDFFIIAQIKEIIKDAINWKAGEWTFDSLARIKEGICFDVSLESNLFDYAKGLDDQKILSRFKSFDEEFTLKPNTQSNIAFNFSPHEAFLLSRMGNELLKIEDLKAMSGLPNNEILKALYALWLGGLIQRHRWNSAFTLTDVSTFNSAALTKKASALSVNEEIDKAEEQKIKEQAEAEAQKVAEEAKTQAEEIKEEKEKNDKAKEFELSLEEYLNRVETAATHYDIFGVKSTADISVIKKTYFALAKKFHPDLFHRQVDAKLESRIQNAFTELAHAYDTLRDDEAREVYNFKLRKVLEAIQDNGGDSDVVITKENLESSQNSALALENFDKGYNHLMEENYYDALPHLGRAVHLENDNARYHAFYGKALSFDKNQRHQAEAEMQTAVKLDPDNTMYRIMLAELFIEIRLFARAKGELNRLLQIAPNDKEALSLLDSLENK